ncbi:MAG: potassium efflux system protein [Verrucomicrobiales bacterium]|jgi:potassium efflux system protein
MLLRHLLKLLLVLAVFEGLGGGMPAFSQAAPRPPDAKDDPSELVSKETEPSILASDYTRRTAEIDRDFDKLNEQDPTLAPSDLPPSDLETRTLEELVGEFESLKSRLTAAREATESHAAEERSRITRLATLPDLIRDGKVELASLPEASPPLATATDQDKANHQRLVERRERLEQQISTLQAELDYYKASTSLFAAQGQHERQNLANLTKASTAWQIAVNQRRQISTGDAAKRAEKEIEKFSKEPAAKSIAEEISKIAKLHGGKDGLSSRMASASINLAVVRAKRDRVAKQHSSSMRRVNLLEGANLPIDSTTGRLLRRQRQGLTEEVQLRGQLRSALRDSARAQIDLLEHEERQTQLLGEPVTFDQNLIDLRKSRASHLRLLTEDYRSYIASLSETATALRSLGTETSSFIRFVDERLLWIPSTEPISLGDPKIELGAIFEVLAKDPFAFLLNDFLSIPILWGIITLGIVTIALRRKIFLKRLIEQGAIARKRNCTSYTPTAKALLYTLLIAAPLPALGFYIYARTGEAPLGIANGIRNVSAFLTITIVLFGLAHPQGLMIDHFRMAGARVALLRKNLPWFILAMPALVFLATVLPLAASASSAGRLFFMALLVCLLTFIFRVLRPSKQLIHWRGKAPNHLARACFLLGIAAPTALIIGAMAGYFDSVQELRLQLLSSVALILVALLITALSYRWILVSRRRLVVQQALQWRELVVAERAAAEGAKQKGGAKPQHLASPDEVRTEALKTVEVEEQTARLVRATAIAFVAFGIFGIWRPTVPALSALDDVTIWDNRQSESTATNSQPTEEDKTPFSIPLGSAEKDKAGTGKRFDPSDGRVSLQNLVTALITLLLTYVAARNVPGLLELTVFRRLRLQPGSSFAFKTTIRYIIVVTGIVIAFSMIDITWGKVQWIAAAITLGVGFGLQEIFANFVAGLIILFERPIRLGDVVTVGDVSGKVTQIHIRATTIRQFNSRELIVPNKEFITGKLVNWTLSDSVLRFEIIVGIAYGSNTKKATEILLKVANDNQKVLKDPAPDVLFDDFGDSALVFQLRAHVNHVDDLLPARNEIRYAIDDAFREAKIEIAFPQTDIHVRTSGDQHDPRPIGLHPNNDG